MGKHYLRINTIKDFRIQVKDYKVKIYYLNYECQSFKKYFIKNIINLKNK